MDSLTLPPLFRLGSRQYVYCWISPHGNWDDSVYNGDSVNILVGAANYLAARLYPAGYAYISDDGDYISGIPHSTFASWDKVEIILNHSVQLWKLAIRLGAEETLVWIH